MFYKRLVSILSPLIKLIFRMEVIGENYLDEGNIIIAGNHSSNSDPILLSVAFKNQIHWMAKKELFDIGILKYFLDKLEAIPVDRKMGLKAIRDSSKVLKDNKIIGIFPEGKRVKSFNIENAKPGIALIAARNNSIVLPVYIKRRKNLFDRTQIIIGDKIIDFTKDEKLTSQDYEIYSEMILKEIYKLGKVKNVSK